MSSFQSSQQQLQPQSNHQLAMTQSMHITSPLPPPPPPPHPVSIASTNNSVNKPSLTFQSCLTQPPKPPERSCSFKDVDNLQQHSEVGCLVGAVVQGIKTPNSTQLQQPQSKRQRSLTNKDSSTFCLKDLPTIPSNTNNCELEEQSFQKLPSARPKSRLFINNANFLENLEENLQSTTIKITSMKLNDINSSSSIDQTCSFNSNLHNANGPSNKISTNFNKFGTMPSSNKLAAKAAAAALPSNNNEDKQSNDSKNSDTIPEFQRVFGHLRKVTKQNNNEVTNSIGNSNINTI